MEHAARRGLSGGLLLFAAVTIMVSACQWQRSSASGFLESIATDSYGSAIHFKAKVREKYPLEMAREEDRCWNAKKYCKNAPPLPKPGTSGYLFLRVPVSAFLEVGIEYQNTEAQVKSIAAEIASSIHGNVLGFRVSAPENDRALIEMHWKTKGARGSVRGSPSRMSTVSGVGGLWMSSGLESPWQFAQEQPGFDAIGLLAARTALIGTAECSGIVILIRISTLIESESPWYLALTSRHEKILEVRRVGPPEGFFDSEALWFGDDD